MTLAYPLVTPFVGKLVRKSRPSNILFTRPVHRLLHPYIIINLLLVVFRSFLQAIFTSVCRIPFSKPRNVLKQQLVVYVLFKIKLSSSHSPRINCNWCFTACAVLLFHRHSITTYHLRHN